MPKKKKTDDNKHKVDASNVIGLHAAVVEQPITDTLETNYMPYAMSVIVSRAIPEIDGFKPSHRKRFTPCTRCTCWGAPAPRAPTWWARP